MTSLGKNDQIAGVGVALEKAVDENLFEEGVGPVRTAMVWGSCPARRRASRSEILVPWI